MKDARQALVQDYLQDIPDVRSVLVEMLKKVREEEG